ncbi:sensor domain-containing diguanylate cyclase [Deinococcus sp. Arct2-2]|uniref:sensor domain-containing diguanylate cyclase n=1 Tax=Deinococcus sp. Arct2-2 TaxID=2568653 RepID=UPI0010A2DD2D|nr:sensor domain-containing diguanylate cyclase [Deinococcus sp. Arct2-2]THF71633.1 sensor domain-containing diguanylate cyclase [Deinococcus sp. Arct2-2]
MTGAPFPEQEYARLLALAQYEILDTFPEEAFDRVTRLAAHLLKTPVAMVNFVDQHRLWGKAAVGVDPARMPRSEALCAWTILQDTPMVVENAHLDSRFCHNPLVTGDPHIHMYAGAPLTSPSGHRIGTLCVVDDQPHPLTAADLQALQDLAALVVDELELRIKNLQLSRELGAQEQLGQELRRIMDHGRVLEGVTSLMDLDLGPEEITLAAAGLLGEALSTDYTGLILFQGDSLRVEAAYMHPRLPAVAQAVPKQLFSWPGTMTQTLRHAVSPLYLDNYAAHPNAIQQVIDAGIGQIAWLPLGTRGKVTSLLMTVRLNDNPVTEWRSSDRALLEAAGRSVRSALDRRLVMDAALQEARQDPLTGALNRRAFEQDLTEWSAVDKAFTLAMLDLDGLKTVNDAEGHAQGDKVLQVFAGTLSVELGKAANLYRVGGDEFILLSVTTEEDELNEQVDVAVLAARQVSGLRGVSVGIAQSEEASGPALIELADRRMYAVKQRRQERRAALMAE